MNIKKLKSQFIILVVLTVVIITFIIYAFHSENREIQDGGNKDSVTVKIGVLSEENNKITKKLYEGISEICDKFITENNIHINLIYPNTGDSLKSRARQLTELDCNGIIALDAKSARSLKDINTVIPVVFAAISDPESEGLVDSNYHPGGNITGISDYTPCFEQINLIKQLFPDFKNVGIIYNENDKNSIMQLNIAKYQTDELEMNVKEYPVSDFLRLDEVLNSAKQENEVIYLTCDPYMKDNAHKITEFFTKYNIPVIGSCEEMVIDGCIATYVINYKYLGIEAVSMLIDIIVNEKNPADIPVGYTAKCDLRFNVSAAKRLGYLSELNSIQ